MKIQLVENWRSMWRAASMWALTVGLTLPEILQAIADNTDSLPWLDPGWKSIIRLVCIILAMVLRVIKQPSVSGHD